ncbi:hypothetical protein EDE12_106171 [Methylosinus sp. sav-2]|uniref:hypothetical protein n=1 Tax=Methylosinus sp. sav-2 TaxID=2485168 RepID=UPI000A73710F|nr:hypothetical protein [Methylosinus sp. sav-2]TDX64025.1 hypothetical protein EDE12_106171 [Methylosinus sp. sav-2]
MSRPPKSKPQTAAPETAAASARRATKRRKSGASSRSRRVAKTATALDTAERSHAETILEAQAARIAALEASLAEAMRENADLARRLARAYAETCNAEQEAELLRAVVVETAISAHANGSDLRAAAKSRNIANSLERAHTLHSGGAMAVTDGVLR